MAWINSTIDPQKAIERGWSTWDCYLSNWNMSNSQTDTNSLLFPNPATQAIIPSIYGVSIGPYSDVDTCRIQYNINLDITTGPSPISELDILDEKLLTVGSPINYPLPAPLFVRYDLNKLTGASFVANDGSSTLTSYGFGVNGSPSPRLHLVFHLQPPNTLPLLRWPRAYAYLTPALAPTGTETLQICFPCFGRRTININARCGQGTVGVRVGLVSPPAAQVTAGFEAERTAASFPGMTAGTTASATLSPVVNASWLTLWTRSTGPGNGGVSFNIEMRDD